MEYVKEKIQTENIINLNDFRRNRYFEVDELFKPSNEELFVVKAYRRVLDEITKNEREALDKALEKNLRMVKSNAREMKINSLKQRMELEKKDILTRAEKILQNYKLLLKENLNTVRTVDKEKIFFVYRIEENKEIVCAIPAKIELIDGDIHMRKDEGREIIINDDYLKEEKDKKSLLVNIERILNVELKEKIQVEIEKIDILKTKTFVQNYTDKTRVLNFDLNIIKFSLENIDAVLDGNKDYKIYSENMDEDIESYLLCAYKKNKKVCLISLNQEERLSYLTKIALNRSLNIKKEFCEVKNKIQKINDLQEVLCKDEGLKNIYYNIFQDKNFNMYEYKKYKKNINLDSFTYEELDEVIKSIEPREFDIFTTYKNIKQKIFNKAEISCTLDEGENIVGVLQKLKRKISYADIIKSDEYQRVVLELYKKNDVLSRQELIAISKAYANKTRKNNQKWKFKNIFAFKDDVGEEDSISKAKKVMEIYNIFSKELEEIKIFNIDIFSKVVEALRSPNMNGQINIILNELKMKVELLKALEEINTWGNSKYALIEAMNQETNDLDMQAKLLKFKKVFDFEKICNEQKFDSEILDIDMQTIKNNYKKILQEISKTPNEEQFLEIIDKDIFEEKRELIYGKYDIILVKQISIDKSQKYLPYIYESTKILNFIAR